MIDYIKYTVDGAKYQLINNGDGTWGRSLDAPSVAGRYDLMLEIGQNGIRTYIDSSDSRYSFYLMVITEVERETNLMEYLPEIYHDILEFNVIFDTENIELDQLHSEVDKIMLDAFIRTASAERITRIETFLGFKGEGTLEQRKSYLIALMQKGQKLNEESIKDIANAITGSDCIVTFFGSDELDNPQQGFSLLQVQVLSPENNRDYRYEDIVKALRPLVPAHIKLLVVRFFATWEDIGDNFSDWNAVMAKDSWQAIRDYIPPQ